MKIVGLTGGIASGKSTVAHLLRQRKIPVIDADQVAREIVESGEEALFEIIEVFGKEILLPTGELDRKKLGSLIFASPEKRQKLNAITHPRVAQRAQEKFQKHREEGCLLLVYEVPLLFEVGLHKSFDTSLLVAVSEETQLQRLMERDQSSKVEAMNRIQSQMPLHEKVDLADFVLWNDGSSQELEQALDSIWQTILKTLSV